MRIKMTPYSYWIVSYQGSSLQDTATLINHQRSLCTVYRVHCTAYRVPCESRAVQQLGHTDHQFINPYLLYSVPLLLLVVCYEVAGPLHIYRPSVIFFLQIQLVQSSAFYSWYHTSSYFSFPLTSSIICCLFRPLPFDSSLDIVVAGLDRHVVNPNPMAYFSRPRSNSKQ